MRITDIDYTLYLVTDRKLSRGRTTYEIVKAAIQGGVTCIQLREKECSTREFLREALAIRDYLQKSRIPLIINDRIDVAMAVKADGVHLGRNDLPLKIARKMVMKSMIIGISAESVEDAVEAEKGGADYVSASPVFSTPTKPDAALPLGLIGVRKIREAVTIPLVGIGGINCSNLAAVIQNGADGIAVVSAIVAADDPEKEAVKLKQAILKTKYAAPERDR
ncbi:MAG: thiamine-phosphate diphosphorylase [Deltaproteobacteria bacterium RBG_13_49_15]|nr:MAG: thiamine-phosphate diphosphorylase [Deltaproteobacteria bacterium RBG_13_49_15]